jgi:predicted GNAT family N-acyltransferase
VNASDADTGRLSGRIRRARANDVERILDLLTEYDLPRSAFEPFYYGDPTYRPADSWVVDLDGQLLAHLRIYPRTIYMQGVPVRVAGIGNVITAHRARGCGHAGRLLRAVLCALPDEGYAYSLLWTHLPEMYARFGWTTIPEPRLEATIPSRTGRASVQIRPWTDADLMAVTQLYEHINRDRAGAVKRTPEYWHAQLNWLHLERREALVASEDQNGLSAYARGALRGNSVELLELGFSKSGVLAARDLVAELAVPARGQLYGALPPSVLGAIPAERRTLTISNALMGRTVDLRQLASALEPLWQARTADLDLPATELAFSTAAGALHLHLHDRVVRVEVLQRSPGVDDEHEFAQLLLRGFDELARARAVNRPESQRILVQALFPAQDFAIWGADSF